MIPAAIVPASISSMGITCPHLRQLVRMIPLEVRKLHRVQAKAIPPRLVATGGAS